MNGLEQHIESLIFSSEQPIGYQEIKDCLEQSMDTKLKKELVHSALENILAKYRGGEYAFEVVEISGGYQFLTKGAYHHTVGTLLKQKAKKRLSKSALETLAIIAYKQPVTKSQAEAVRGVSCDYSIQKLLEKELIVIIGRSDGPGKPLLYATSKKFMDYFGLKSIKDLPKLRELSPEEKNTIGKAAAIEDAAPQAAAETTSVTSENQEVIISEEVIEAAIAEDHSNEKEEKSNDPE